MFKLRFSRMHRLLNFVNKTHLPVWKDKRIITNLNDVATLCGLKPHIHFPHYSTNVPDMIEVSETAVQRNPQDGRNFEELLTELEGKIIYNSYLESKRLKLGYHKNKAAEMKLLKQAEVARIKMQQIQPLPASLKYIMDEEKPVEAKVPEPGTDEFQLTHFPFEKPLVVNKKEIFEETVTEEPRTENFQTDKESVPGKWMSDYEVYPEDIEEDETEAWKLNYGTPNPKSKVSNIPCGGCGALLHCKDTSIPGYLPREIYDNVSKLELNSLICQRCHFLKTYNIALQVHVSPEEYPKILSTIQPKWALVVLMVDLMDFPCSIWPNIMNIIGNKRPVIVVGNKVDLLPQDSRGFLLNIKNVLEKTIRNSNVSKANIKHIALISAKTGFGVEELINKLHTSWEYKGDVYLIGCTNVGKSTLFNSLLQSDYCKIQAVDLIQRATISQWPGTTLNLLKFPILRPSGWRLYERTQRMISQRKTNQAEQQLRKVQLRETKDPVYASLIGHIDRTFTKIKPVDMNKDPFALGTNPNASSGLPVGLNENAAEYAASKWCYDTPGVVQPDQVLHLLTTDELMKTLPKDLIRPRTYSIKPGMSVFIAGLGRLDLLTGPRSVRFTVFASNMLPITICETKNAQILYEKLLGSQVFAVPEGTSNRLSKWPCLDSSEDINIIGESWECSCADVVLSSAGWIAVTIGKDLPCTLKAWTPERRGIYVRDSILPHAVNLRGKRIRYSPAYQKSSFFIK